MTRPKKKAGRPRVPLKDKVRRGTVEPSRERTAPKKRARGRNRSDTATEPRDYLALLDGYITGIESGAIVACRWTKLAVQRFERMRSASSVPRLHSLVKTESTETPIATPAESGAQTVRSRTPPRTTFESKRTYKHLRTLRQDPAVWSPNHVRDVCAFVERLPHVEGRWSTSTIQLEPWQIFLLAAVYGFRHEGRTGNSKRLPGNLFSQSDGSRLVTTVFFEVGRKSAKSTLVAACALYHLAVEREPGGQVIAGATTGAQARIVFGIMQRMIRRAPWLRELGFVAYANGITIDATGGCARPINARSSTQDGLNPSFISLDESHAQTFELHDVLKSAQGSRRDPLLMAPTTAGYDMTSVGFALRSTAQKILDGVVEAPHVFCVLYELDEGDRWDDESVWPKALPMLGITPSLDYVRRYCLDATQTPGLQGEFETKVCNRWLHSASTWLSMPAWTKCADPTLQLEDFHHEPCWIGVDLAERDDICAVALLFKRNDLVHVFVRGYLPALVVNERARAVPEYRLWLQKGELIATDGNLTDYPTIEADLRADCETFDVQEIAIEKYGALHLAANLANVGVPVRLEGKHAKTFTPPAKELEARIKAQQLRHTGSSFLTWQISNVCVERRRDGSLLPTKDAAMSVNKIDAVDALLLALSGMVAAPTVAVAEPRIWFLEA